MGLRERKWLPGIILVALTILLMMSGLMLVLAQDEDSGMYPRDDQTNPRACPVSATRSEPGQIQAGETRTLTVFGSGFSATTAVRLSGYGVLETTLVNSGAVTGAIPDNIPAGSYNVRIVDPSCGTIDYPNTSRLRLSVTPALLPTVTPGDVEIPTPFPGAPSLLPRNFVATPSTIKPGGTVSLLFDVYNQGNRTAEGVSASLDSGGSFLPSGGQATVILPDIPPGGTASIALTVIAAQNAEPGPASVPVTLNYRDFTGDPYSSKAALSVTIERVVQTTQVILSRYLVNPDPVVPGEKVNINITVNNTGNTPAQQALIRMGSEGVLLAGPQGDSFPLADLLPGATATLDLPLIAKPDAKAGPQSQPFTITYLLNGEAQTIEGTMTINVTRVVEKSPVMLLDAYNVDQDPLEPGAQFELSVDLKNVGDVTAIGTLVTFGSVETTGDDSGSGSGSGSGSSTSTTPSTTFAPLGTGGTLFLGDIAAQKVLSFKQEFIVSGTVNSGVYSLPITLRYQKPDGTVAQDNLRASVVVIKPPALRVLLQSPPPEFATVGDSITLIYDLLNGGTSTLELTNATTEAENGDVIDGAETLVGDVVGNDQGTYSSTVIPNAAGTMTITVTLRYLDDLNNERAIVNTYTVEVSELPEEPQIEPTPDLIPEPTPEVVEDNNWLGRLLLGLLGLGS